MNNLCKVLSESGTAGNQTRKLSVATNHYTTRWHTGQHFQMCIWTVRQRRWKCDRQPEVRQAVQRDERCARASHVSQTADHRRTAGVACRSSSATGRCPVRPAHQRSRSAVARTTHSTLCHPQHTITHLLSHAAVREFQWQQTNGALHSLPLAPLAWWTRLGSVPAVVSQSISQGDRSIDWSIDQWINQWINQRMNQSTNEWINQSINQSNK